jgi:hypothetical protein
MVGYAIESEVTLAKIAIERYLKTLNFTPALLQAALYTGIFGDAYLEKRRNEIGDVVKLFAVDPRTIIINYDEYGRIIDYQQTIDGRTVGTPIKPIDIMHFRFWPIPGSPYGMSMLQPNMKTIERKKDTDEAIFNSVKRHAFRKMVVTVGDKDDGQIPPDDIMDDITEKLEDINEINEFVVPWMIKIDTIDEKGIQGIEELYGYFLSQLVTGLMCPEEALGQSKNASEATSRVKSILYERMITANQFAIADVVREDLINEYLLLYSKQNADFIDKMTGQPIRVEMKFNSASEEDEAMKAKWLGNFMRGFPEGTKPLSINEMRFILGFAPVHGEEYDSLSYKPPSNGEPNTVNQPNVVKPSNNGIKEENGQSNTQV